MPNLQNYAITYISESVSLPLEITKEYPITNHILHHYLLLRRYSSVPAPHSKQALLQLPSNLWQRLFHRESWNQQQHLPGARDCIVATNLAEVSLTTEGIYCMLRSGSEILQAKNVQSKIGYGFVDRNARESSTYPYVYPCSTKDHPHHHLSRRVPYHHHHHHPTWGRSVV